MYDEKEHVRKMLGAMDLVFDEDDEVENYRQTLNMNDVWGWAVSWLEEIPDDELIAVGHLVRRYGYAGALYWVSKRNNNMRSEFEDINRFVSFVREEEAILAEFPDPNKRAYAKRTYAI